jgi:hypothetical protein
VPNSEHKVELVAFCVKKFSIFDELGRSVREEGGAFWVWRLDPYFSSDEMTWEPKRRTKNAQSHHNFLVTVWFCPEAKHPN